LIKRVSFRFLLHYKNYINQGTHDDQLQLHISTQCSNDDRVIWSECNMSVHRRCSSFFFAVSNVWWRWTKVSLVRWKKSNMSTFSSTQFVLTSHSNALFLRHTKGRKKIILIGAERALSSLIFYLSSSQNREKKWGKKSSKMKNVFQINCTVHVLSFHLLEKNRKNWAEHCWTWLQVVCLFVNILVVPSEITSKHIHLKRE
jgi:hypothetical protein